MLIRALLLAIVVTCSACASFGRQKQRHPDAIAIMAYNSENLFDTLQDKDREDFTFLPLKLKGSKEHTDFCNKQSGSRRDECLNMDWNEDVLSTKLDRLANVILSVNDGKGPDILILEEVENIHVLKLLNERLKERKFSEVILIEGPDIRGIDIGMMSRFPQIAPAQLHKIAFQPKTEDDKEWMARSRGILHSQFRLPSGQPIHVFGVHFPSQANPTYWREQAIDTLNGLLDSLPKGSLAVGGGDFNISAEEDTKVGLFRDRIRSHWLVSHYMGCGNCHGSHNYKGSWSFLDALIFSKDFSPDGNGAMKVDPDSINVINESRFQKTTFQTPARFNENRAEGVSDHFPIYGEIVPR